MENTSLQNAKRYAKIRHNLALFETIFTVCLLATIQFTGLSEKFKTLSMTLSVNSLVIVAAYTLILSAFSNIFLFWFDYFGGYKLEHMFNLSRQNFASWIKDYFKKLLIGGAVSLVTIEVLYFLLTRFAYTWWIWASIFYLFFSLFIARIFPSIIIPLFYKLENIEDEDLKNKLLNLAKKAGIKILDIYKIGLGKKTKKANAALTGIGSSKRILLSDTLLENYSQDEIEAVLAHELAHHKYKHFWKLVSLSSLLTIISFVVVQAFYSLILLKITKLPIYDISLFPALASVFILFNFTSTPVSNAVSRYFETQADDEAINLSQKPAAFVSLMEKLTKQNLSDPEPSKIVEIFFYDHPPAAKRIKRAIKKM